MRAPESPETARPISKPKRLAWRCVRLVLAFVVAPIVLLALLELGLRAAGYGHSTRVFVAREFEGEKFYSTNEAFFEQFFSMPLRRDMWEYLELDVPATKPEDAYRIVVLGGSAALGVQPDFAFSFGRVLVTMLEARYPGVRFELYDVAHSGLNSHAMRSAAKAFAKRRPGLFVIYMGNNEVNGPFGAVTAVGKRWSWSLPFIRAKTAATDLRIAQLATGHGRQAWRMPVETRDDDLPLDGPRMKKVFEYYRANLDDILGSATRSGAAVALCTVGCNVRDWRPVLSMNRRDLTGPDKESWEHLYQAGIARQDGGRHAEALATYAEAVDIDGKHAELCFRMGQCHWELGDYESARQCFIQAWDLDLFRSRVPRPLNEIIRETAMALADDDVRFVEAAGRLEESSPHGIAGNELFFDDVHLTFAGNYTIARAVFEQVAEVLPLWVRERAKGEGAPLTQAECAHRLGMSPGVRERHIRRILQTNSEWHKQPVPHLEQELAELEEMGIRRLAKIRAEGYVQALELSGSDWVKRMRYAQALLDLADLEGALEQARVLVSGFPRRRVTRRFLGILLARAGKTAEAIEQFETCVALYPDDYDAYLEWARALEREERLDEAMALYGRALGIDPDNALAKCGEGGIHAKAGRGEAALKAYREAIVLDPARWEPYAGIDAFYKDRNDPEGCAATWRAIAHDHPGAVQAYLRLGMALEAGADTAGAIAVYRQAAEANPDDAALHACLGEALAKDGRLEEAIAPLGRALDLNPRIDRLYPLLLRALREAGDYEAARERVAQCERLGVALPPGTADALARDARSAPPKGDTGDAPKH